MPWRLWRSRHKRKQSLNSLHFMDGDREDLLPQSRAETQQLHPKLWLVLGVCYVCLGVVQLILASLWRWWFGMAVGFGVGKMGMSLWGLGWTSGRPPAPPARGCFGWIKNLARRALMWGAGKVQSLFFFFRWLIYGYGLVVLLMVSIHLSSPDYRFAYFPNECPADKQYGCSRIAESNPHSARQLTPLHLTATLPDVERQVTAWVEEQAQARLLGDTRPGFLHARFLSLFWGFADDFMVSLRCSEEHKVVVEVQGQLRIGKSDFGVNGRRNERFLLDLSHAAQKGVIPKGLCLTDAEIQEQQQQAEQQRKQKGQQKGGQ